MNHKKNDSVQNIHEKYEELKDMRIYKFVWSMLYITKLAT